MTAMSDEETKGIQQLPRNYRLGEWDVICARGKLSQENKGNIKMKSMIQSCLHEYTRSDDKAAKGRVVSSVIDVIRSHGGNFVKFSVDGFVLVSERFTREKVGQQFRDLLHTKYKSSTKAKARATRVHQAVNLEQQQLAPESVVSASTLPLKGAATAMLSACNNEADMFSSALFGHHDQSLASQLACNPQLTACGHLKPNPLSFVAKPIAQNIEPLPFAIRPLSVRPAEPQLIKPRHSSPNIATNQVQTSLPSAESLAVLSDLELPSADLELPSSRDAFLWESD